MQPLGPRHARFPFVLGAALLVAGSALLYGSGRRAQEVWSLTEGLSAEAVAESSEPGPLTGGFPILVHEGERYRCTGGAKNPGFHVPVRFDPDDPSRCREASLIGELGSYETIMLAFPIVFLFFGLALFGLGFYLRRRFAT